MPTPEQIAEANYRASLLADTIAGSRQASASPAAAQTRRVAAVANPDLDYGFGAAGNRGIFQQRQSPPIRYGQLYGANGVHSGTTYFEPVNQSASPVIGGYSPYATMLYAPPRRNRFLEMQAMFNAFRPDPAMMQQIFQQIIRQPIRMGGTGKPAGTNKNTTTPTKPGDITYKPVQPKLDPRLAGGPTNQNNVPVPPDMPSGMPVNPDLDYGFHEPGNKGIFQNRQSQRPLRGDPYENSMWRGAEAGGKIVPRAGQNAADANWDANNLAAQAMLNGDKDAAARILSRNALRTYPLPIVGMNIVGPGAGSYRFPTPQLNAPSPAGSIPYGSDSFVGVAGRNVPQLGYTEGAAIAPRRLPTVVSPGQGQLIPR